MWKETRRSALSAHIIDEQEAKLKRNCHQCKNLAENCDDCVGKLARLIPAIRAGFPIGKYQEMLEIQIDERELLEYKHALDLGTPGHYDTRRFKLYSEVIWSYANDWNRIREKGLSMIWVGDNGLGKTGAALCLGARLLANKPQPVDVFYCRFPEIHAYHSRSFGQTEDARENVKLLREIQTSEFLIIDELGAETTASESVRGLADSWLKTREEEHRPTLLLTNTPATALGTEPSEREKGYGRRFLAHTQSRYRIFGFVSDGPNLRLRHQAAWPF